MRNIDFKTVLPSLIFVLVSSYVVLFYEREQSNVFYYFYQTVLFKIFLTKFDPDFVKTWYAGYKRFVFPLNYWAVFGSYLVLLKLVFKKDFIFKNASRLVPVALFFHIYLLLLNHKRMASPWLNVLPGGVKLGVVIPWYNDFATGAALAVFYCFSIRSVIKGFSSPGLCGGGDFAVCIDCSIPLFGI